MVYIFIVFCTFFVACLTLQRKCWFFVWKLNGFRGLMQQPLLWALLIFYIEPNRIFQMTSRWRKFFQRPLAIIIGTRILLYVDDPYTMEQVLNSHECLNKTFLQNGFFARKGLLHASGQQWRIRRKQLNPAFSHSILLSFFNIFNSVGNQLQYAFSELLLQDKMKATAISFEDVENLLSRAALEVSCLTTLGTETNFTKNDANGIASAYKKLLQISALRIMKPWLQNDRIFRLLDCKNYERYMECNKLVKQFVENIVQRKHEAWLARKNQQTGVGMAAKNATIESKNCNGGNDNDDDNGVNGVYNVCNGSHLHCHCPHNDVYKENGKEAEEVLTDDIETTQQQKRIFIEQIFHLATLGELTLEDILNETEAMILVSFETISNSLIIALLLLAMHPDCQRKLRNEITATFCKNPKDIEGVTTSGVDCVAGENIAVGDIYTMDNDNINVKQLQQMKYLDMIVNESLRLLTTVPINMRHVSNDFHLQLQEQDLQHHQQQQQRQQNGQHKLPTVLSVVVPKDTIIVVDTFNMQRDVKYWGPTAKQFKPEEHFTSNATKGHSYAFIPFSKGLRSCIGSRYSLLLMKVFLVKLISRFEFRTQLEMAELRFKQEISLKFQHADSITFQLCQLEIESKGVVKGNDCDTTGN